MASSRGLGRGSGVSQSPNHASSTARVVKELSGSGVELKQAAESVATANGPAPRPKRSLKGRGECCPCLDGACRKSHRRPEPAGEHWLRVRCSSRASSGATGRREESTLLSANKTESRPVAIANRHTRPWAGIAAWIATFRLRVARSGGEVRQLAVWRLRRRVLAGARAAAPVCPWPVRGASWIGDNTPGMISRAGTVKPR